MAYAARKANVARVRGPQCAAGCPFNGYPGVNRKMWKPMEKSQEDDIQMVGFPHLCHIVSLPEGTVYCWTCWTMLNTILVAFFRKRYPICFGDSNLEVTSWLKASCFGVPRRPVVPQMTCCFWRTHPHLTTWCRIFEEIGAAQYLILEEYLRKSEDIWWNSVLFCWFPEAFRY